MAEASQRTVLRARDSGGRRVYSQVKEVHMAIQKKQNGLQTAGKGIMAFGMLLILIPILVVCVIFAWAVLSSVL
jgi:hypothetical protein